MTHTLRCFLRLIWKLSERLPPGRLITMGEYGAEALDAYETISQHAPPHFPQVPPASDDTLWWQVQVQKADARQWIGLRGTRPSNLGQYIEASQNYQADLLAERTKAFRLSPRRVSGYFQFHFIDATAAHWPKSIVSHDFQPKRGYFEMAQVNQPVVPLFQLTDRGKAMEVWVANDLDEALPACRVQWEVRWRDKGLRSGQSQANIAPADATMIAKVDLSSIPQTADTVAISLLLFDSVGKAVSRYDREVYLKAWRQEEEALQWPKEGK